MKNDEYHVRAILVGKDVVPEPNIEKWGRWMETPARLLWRHEIEGHLVSTVFLGLDHGFGRAPLWFETLCFNHQEAGEMRRYATYDEAWAGHRNMVAKALGMILPTLPP